MSAGRAIEIGIGASEDATTTFARDQLMLLRCSQDAVARARVWRRRESGLLLGRFHRADPASRERTAGGRSGANAAATIGDSGVAHESVDAERGGLSRRLSGGRIVPVGPGVVCVTMAVPVVDWLDNAGGALRPDQVLNRALRPLLAMLRSRGVDAFYPGRDLVTVGGRTLAHASFTVMRDGVVVVEMHVAESPAFADLAMLLDRFDPSAAAGVDRGALDGSTSLAETATPAQGDEEWAAQFAACAAKAFACEASVAAEASVGGPAGVEGEGGEAGVTLAHASAARDFLLSPGPLEEGTLTAASVSMLGVVECSARLRGDRLSGLRVTGDLIAPFHTLDDVASECEGEPFRPANVRKALARAMARPRSFVLGLRELDELILKIA